MFLFYLKLIVVLTSKTSILYFCLAVYAYIVWFAFAIFVDVGDWN